MMEAWAIWLILVGLAIGGAFAVVLLIRLPRAEDDIDPYERRTEALWIADTVERHGGVAPVSFVEEVLDLHGAYLQARRPPTPPPDYGPIPPPNTLPPAAPPGSGPPPAAPPTRR